MKRRTVITAAVALPCIGVVGSAPAATSNATDALWLEWTEARTAYEAASRKHHSLEGAIPRHLSLDVMPRPYSPEWETWDRATWHRGREAYGVDAAGKAVDASVDKLNAIEAAILETPAATLADVERKLSLLDKIADSSIIGREYIHGLLVDVQRIAGEVS